MKNGLWGVKWKTHVNQLDLEQFHWDLKRKPKETHPKALLLLLVKVIFQQIGWNLKTLMWKLILQNIQVENLVCTTKESTRFPVKYTSTKEYSMLMKGSPNVFHTSSCPNNLWKMGSRKPNQYCWSKRKIQESWWTSRNSSGRHS